MSADPCAALQFFPHKGLTIGPQRCAEAIDLRPCNNQDATEKLGVITPLHQNQSFWGGDALKRFWLLSFINLPVSRGEPQPPVGPWHPFATAGCISVYCCFIGLANPS